MAGFAGAGSPGLSLAATLINLMLLAEQISIQVSLLPRAAASACETVGANAAIRIAKP